MTSENGVTGHTYTQLSGTRSKEMREIVKYACDTNQH